MRGAHRLRRRVGPPASVAAGSRSGPDAPDAGETAPDVEVADASEPAEDALEPVDASRTAVAIAVGAYTSCALMSDGTVECWGFGEDGELGDGKLSDRSTPARVPGIHGATAISPGMYVRCALLRGGDVECWGDNAEGEIQNPPTLNPSAIPTPVAVPRWKGAKEIVSVSRTTCALLADSTVSCAGTSPTPSSPWTIQGSSGSTQIGLWDFGGCAVGPGGTVACWGDNDEGQLGGGTADFTYGFTAVRVPGLEGVTSIATGSSGFTCALLSNAAVSCWGVNNTGQLGSATAGCSDGNGGSCSEVPIPVPGLTGVTALTAGESFACAVLTNGTVDCWGDNFSGELGERNDEGLVCAHARSRIEPRHRHLGVRLPHLRGHRRRLRRVLGRQTRTASSVRRRRSSALLRVRRGQSSSGRDGASGGGARAVRAADDPQPHVPPWHFWPAGQSFLLPHCAQRPSS